MMQQVEENHDDQVSRADLLLDLECEVHASRGCTFDIPAKFFSLLPNFKWSEGGYEWEAEMIVPRLRIIQLNKTT